MHIDAINKPMLAGKVLSVGRHHGLASWTMKCDIECVARYLTTHEGSSSCFLTLFIILHSREERVGPHLW